MTPLNPSRSKTERNAWVELRYDALMAEGKHGHYETLFRIVREAIEAAVEVEREACAKLADLSAALDRRKGERFKDVLDNGDNSYEDFALTAESIAKQIRFRSQL